MKKPQNSKAAIKFNKSLIVVRSFAGGWAVAGVSRLTAKQKNFQFRIRTYQFHFYCRLHSNPSILSRAFHHSNIQNLFLTEFNSSPQTLYCHAGSFIGDVSWNRYYAFAGQRPGQAFFVGEIYFARVFALQCVYEWRGCFEFPGWFSYQDFITKRL